MENILHTIFLKLPPFRLDISEAFVEARQFRFLISNTTRGKFLLQIISRFSRHIFFVFLIEPCNVACLCSSEGSVTELLNTGVAQRKQRLCDVEDSRGTYIKTRSCSGLSGFYIFFSLSIRCVSQSEEHLVKISRHFHSRSFFAISVQPSQHFTFVLPSVLSFASSQSNCFHDFFRLKYMFETTPSLLQIVQFLAVDFFISLLLWCIRRLNQVEATMIHQR